MADDDIDSLIAEAEEALNMDSAGKAHALLRSSTMSHRTESRCQAKASFSSLTKDINDILADDDDIEHKASSPKLESLAQDSVKKVSVGTTKCSPGPMLGNPRMASGCSTSLNQRACDNLMCLNCDFKVISFDHFRWDISADYLFLRNNVPEYSRLKEKLVPLQGGRAYACQCRQRSVTDSLSIRDDADLKWTCMKH